MLHSCLYKARVMHTRIDPKQNKFHYDVFMFYLDLDEIDTLHRQLKFMSRNRFNLFNFRDKDHLQLTKDNPDKKKNVRQHITDYLLANNVNIGSGRIMLLTNLCTQKNQKNPKTKNFCYN